MNDLELIERLADLGEHLDRELVAAADGLADSVVAMLDTGPVTPARSRGIAGRPRLWALAAAVVLLVVLVVALPGPRRTVARWFGIGAVRIERVPAAPRTATVTTPQSDPLRLGPPVTADDAMAATGLPLPVAAVLGDPESFHVPGGPQIVARYDVGGRDVLVAVLGGTTDEAVFLKRASSGQITDVDVDGTSGLWVTGEPHDFGYVDTDGELASERLRLAGDTLLWVRDGMTLRVEGASDIAAALAIARSVEL
jgi:hypothetical protein